MREFTLTTETKTETHSTEHFTRKQLATHKCNSRMQFENAIRNKLLLWLLRQSVCLSLDFIIYFLI